MELERSRRGNILLILIDMNNPTNPSKALYTETQIFWEFIRKEIIGIFIYIVNSRLHEREIPNSTKSKLYEYKTCHHLTPNWYCYCTHAQHPCIKDIATRQHIQIKWRPSYHTHCTMAKFSNVHCSVLCFLISDELFTHCTRTTYTFTQRSASHMQLIKIALGDQYPRKSCNGKWSKLKRLQ